MFEQYCLCDLCLCDILPMPVALKSFCNCSPHQNVTGSGKYSFSNDILKYAKSSSNENAFCLAQAWNTKKIPIQALENEMHDEVKSSTRSGIKAEDSEEEPIIVRISLDPNDHLDKEFQAEDILSCQSNEFDDSDQIQSYVSFKRTCTRKDVMLKTIARSMRRFYYRETKYIFKKIKNQDSNKLSFHHVFQKAKEYINSKIVVQSSNKMAYFLLSIAGNKKILKDSNSKYLELTDFMHDMLYSFGTAKLMDLLRSPEFSVLMCHYLRKPNILQLIRKRAGNSKSNDAFKFYIEEIERVCEEWNEIRSRV